MDTIYGVYGCFYNMSTKNAESLEQGVKDIQAYQETQSTYQLTQSLLQFRWDAADELDQIRQTLVDFRQGVAMISNRLVGGDGGRDASRNGQSRGDTPSTPGSGSGKRK